jgi:uncharacterized membrane protein
MIDVDALIPMVVCTTMFAMVYGIVYLYRRERMAMIERGMDPRSYKPKVHNYNTLKWGLLLIGAGLGLFLAYILDHTCLAFMNREYEHNPSIYFALIAIFGGAGLLISHLVERKDLPVHQD